MSLEENKSTKYLNKGLGSEIKKHGVLKNSCLNYITAKYKKKVPEKVNPKLKLPPLLKASDNATFQHEIWSTDAKYNEVKGQINLFKEELSNQQPHEPNLCTQNEDDPENKLNETEIDLSLVSILEQIVLLDNKIESSCLDLEEVQKVRLKEQNEICKKIQSLDTCPFEQRSSQSFHKLCGFKSKGNTKKNKNVPINKVKFIINRRKRLLLNRHKLYDKSKNIELPNLKMSTSALTDEEKARLQLLLADISDDDENDNIPTRDIEVHNKTYVNAFIFNDGEETKLSEIQEKLTMYADASDKKDVKKPDLKNVDSKNYEQISWKEIKETSIKEIDKAIAAIHEAEPTENNDKEVENTST